MIVGPLKNNIQFSVIILLIICIGLWINTLLLSNAHIPHNNYPEHILYDSVFGNLSFNIVQMITLAAVLFGAFFINFIAIQEEITAKNNFLPAFFYILFAFSSTSKTTLEPILVANIFVLPALYFLISSYREEQALSHYFKVGLFMGLSSFFCIDTILMFPVLFVALLILRPFHWREWIGLALGLSAPLFIYICTCYLSNTDLLTGYYKLKEATQQFQAPVVSEYYVGFLIITVLLFVLALFYYLSKGFGAKVKTQKTKYVLLWLLGSTGIMVFFEQIPDMIFLTCIIPLSIILGDYVAEIKQLKIANTFLFLFMGGFVVVYFHALGII